MPPLSDSRIPVDLLDRYLAGEAAPKERAEVEAILGANAEVGGMAQAVQSRPALSDALWTRFQQTSPLKTGLEKPKRRPWYKTVPVFVAGGLAAVLGLVFVYQAQESTLTVQHSYTTQPGQRSQVQLPDGSQMTLAPASQVTYQEDTRGRRALTVTGQALFRVIHDPERPFVVTSGPATTRVLGTTFDVRYYHDDSVAQVAVLEGKVESKGGTTPVLLAAGMVGLVNDSTATTLERADVHTLTGWSNGQLVFKNVPVCAMLATLGRWYGYEFRITDSVLARVPVSATLAVDAPDETLRALQDMLSVRVKFDGATVILSPDDATVKRRSVPLRRTPKQNTNTKLEVGR